MTPRTSSIVIPTCIACAFHDATLDGTNMRAITIASPRTAKTPHSSSLRRVIFWQAGFSQGGKYPLVPRFRTNEFLRFTHSCILIEDDQNDRSVSEPQKLYGVLVHGVNFHADSNSDLAYLHPWLDLLDLPRCFCRSGLSGLQCNDQ